jgi:hypothetical protein
MHLRVHVDLIALLRHAVLAVSEPRQHGARLRMHSLCSSITFFRRCHRCRRCGSSLSPLHHKSARLVRSSYFSSSSPLCFKKQKWRQRKSPGGGNKEKALDPPDLSPSSKSEEDSVYDSDVVYSSKDEFEDQGSSDEDDDLLEEQKRSGSP